MAQSKKCLLYKHEVLGSNPQHMLLHPVLGSQSQVSRRSFWPFSLATAMMTSRLSGRPCLKIQGDLSLAQTFRSFPWLPSIRLSLGRVDLIPRSLSCMTVEATFIVPRY